MAGQREPGPCRAHRPPGRGTDVPAPPARNPVTATGACRLELAWLLLGISLLLLAFADALWTTLWVDGSAGPIVSRLTTWAWRGVLAVAGRRRHRALSLFGPTILVAAVATWGLLLWAGWTFVFAGGATSLVRASPPGEPADWSSRIWFVAYAVSTMGNGDYRPNGDVWELVASLTTLSGFFLATLVISYLLSVVSAVVAKRAFAGQVAGLGRTAEEVVRTGWDGRSLRSLDLPLALLSTQLGSLAERYLSYPVLQYYHAARAAKSPAVAIVLLDEALTILRYGVAESVRPSAAVLRSARAEVARYLNTLESAFIRPAAEAPPPPDLGELREAGIPTVSDREFAEALDRLKDRRRKLLGLLRSDGWNWSDR